MKHLKIKHLVLIFLLTNLTTGMAQQLDYYPPQNESVSDSNYEYGITILKETYADIKKNKGELHYVNHWNLAVAYMMLRHENKDFVKQSLDKSRELHPANFAEIFLDDTNTASKWEGYLTSEEFNKFREKSLLTLKNRKTVKSNKISKNSIFDKRTSLQKIIFKLNIDDQKFRSSNMEKQRLLDKKNIQIVDSLYTQLGVYIGESLVGKKYAHVMWSVIQHSDLTTMEKYLPVIHTAVKNNQLKEGALKLLIDRIYAAKNGFQIFGSQSGVPMANDKVIKFVKNKYFINGFDAVKSSGSTSKKDIYHPKINASTNKTIQKNKTNTSNKFPSAKRVGF